MLPGISAPDPVGAVLMCLAGMAWGLYSIRGKGTSSPIAMTAGNFLRSAPMAAVASAIAFSYVQLEPPGIVLALISGTLTSALGYILWYQVLRSLTTTQASVVQLLVPVLAAFGGVVFLAEPVLVRLIAASTLILGGVSLTVMKRNTTTGLKVN